MFRPSCALSPLRRRMLFGATIGFGGNSERLETIATALHVPNGNLEQSSPVRE